MSKSACWSSATVTPPQQLEHVANWLLEERPFMLREQPWARATMIVAGPPQIDHDPDTELVVAPPTSP